MRPKQSSRTKKGKIIPIQIEKRQEIPLSSLVTNESIRTAMPEFDDFSEEDQRFVRDELLKIMDERVKLGMSFLATGESLKKVRDKLAPMKLFSKFCKNLNFTRSTANKYIKSFERVQKSLPNPGLRVAMAMGVKILSDNDEEPLGVYTHAIKGLLMPKGDDPQQWYGFWTDAEKNRRRIAATSIERRRNVEVDVDALLKNAYRNTTRRLNKIPAGKRRVSAFERLTSYLMHDLGISHKTFSAEAVPEDFPGVVGRPKKSTEEEDED